MFVIYRHDLTKCQAPHTFLNNIMVAMNYTLVDKHGVILHVGSLNRNTSWTSQGNHVCELDFNRWAGSTLPFLLSTHHLIGAYFLTTKGDKRIRLLTRLYGTRK